MKKTKAIIFDFDGVILESMDVKTEAFAFLFKDYSEHVPAIIALHRKHGGMPRFEKFEIIYSDILKQDLSEDEKNDLGKRFSEHVYHKVLKCPFVEGAQEFLEKHYQRIPLFIASGTPEQEIKSIIKERGLDKYFRGVFGSPSKKKDIILKIIKEFNFNPQEIIFIGDAIEDYNGARGAGVKFIGRITENSSFEGLKVDGVIHNLFNLERAI